MADKKERAQNCRLLTWEAPRCFIMNIEFTEGKPRVRNFEGGNNPNNPCQPGSPNFDPTLNRCFRRGPS